MLIVDSKIVQKFKGVINGVEIHEEGTFYTVEWFLGDLLEDILFKDTLDMHELTQMIYNATYRYEYKAEYFSRAELENDLHFARMELLDIQEGAEYYEVIPPYYYEAVFKYLQEHMVYQEEE